MSTQTTDLARTSALFEALGLGLIDADADGCFTMRYDERTSLHFQIVPGADLLKLAVSLCTLHANERAQGLRVVLRANLDAPRAERAGSLSVVPSTGQVLFNTVVPLAAPAADTTRPMNPTEFGTVLSQLLSEALGWRGKLTRDVGATSVSLSPLEGAQHVIRP